ncbi:hypothetical protein [Shewanella chilikensis]|uniref:hypothetical protein n=1 Tax=Shewanella chilikensis TaxID=558541 RepID=UPI003A983F09
MSTEQERDQLWNVSFETYYDSYFEEMVADKLLYRWCLLDDVTKWLVAITASGSAVSGWALWGEVNGGFKISWAVIAGAAALLAITHNALGVQQRIKNWEDGKKAFVILRLDLETLRQDMATFPEFDVESYSTKYALLRAKYSELMSRISPDTLRTKRLELKIQDSLNEVLSNQIQG